MTALHRVMAAIEGRMQPRPPFTMTLSLYGSRLTNCPLSEYFCNPACYVAGQEAILDSFNPDIIFAPFVLTYEAAAFGSELHRLPDSPPNVRKPAVKNAEEFLAIPVPDPDTDEHLLFISESVRLLADRLKGQTPICGIATAPVDLPALVMGIDEWINTLVNRPEMARAVMDVTTQYFAAYANALLADGATFIALPIIFANPALVYKKLIDEMLLPALNDAFKLVNGPIVFHHGGNRIADFLSDFLSLPNVAGFALDPRDSFADARTKLGADRLLLGNLNGLTLSACGTEEICKKVTNILDDRSADPHFIFATSGADVPLSTPPERIKAVADLIQSHRVRQ